MTYEYAPVPGCPQHPRFAPDAFCAALRGRNLVIIGDSMSHQMYANAALVLAFGNARPPGGGFRDHIKGQRLSTQICNASRVFFTRSVQLMLDDNPRFRNYTRGTAKDEKWSESLRRGEMGADPVVVMNCGMHEPRAEPNATLAATSSRFFISALSFVRAALPLATVVARTTSPAHFPCTNTSAAVLLGMSPSPIPRYSAQQLALMKPWERPRDGRRIERNDMLRAALSGPTAPVGVLLLDIERLSRLRPDRHKKPPLDCVHYEIPSDPVITWLEQLQLILVAAG